MHPTIQVVKWTMVILLGPLYAFKNPSYVWGIPNFPDFPGKKLEVHFLRIPCTYGTQDPLT